MPPTQTLLCIPYYLIPHQESLRFLHRIQVDLERILYDLFVYGHAVIQGVVEV